MSRTRHPFSRLFAITLASGAAIGLSNLAVAQTADAKAPDPAAKSATEKPASKSAEGIPVRKITLYRSGVGYFERQGTVADATELQLRFNTDQINDILKSMVLLDLDGGKIESVSYGSKEPLAKRLASFGVNIADNPSVYELMGRLRGAEVKIAYATTEITGTILGVESRKMPGGKDQPALDVQHVNILTPTGIKSIPLPDIQSFDILDKELAGELSKALAALAEYRADRSKTVDIRFSGAGNRRVVVGYVHEMPVWKTSYRLVLPDPIGDPAKKGEKPSTMTMQGWAIVENTTDQDWNDVRLSLVSGRPVSFQMDLYEPLFTSRPFVPVPTIPGVMPRAYAGGVDLKDKDASGSTDYAYAGYKFRNAPGAPPPAAAPAMRAAPQIDLKATMEAGSGGGQSPFTGDDMVNYGAKSQATAGEVGEVFQYQLDAPVSIERQRSAMLPILTGTVQGRRVSIFAPADSTDHPMRGVEIVNDSGLQLLPGPISVFDGAAYAGDAQIGHVSKGDKRLLAYSVDLDVNVLTKTDSQSNIVKLRIVNGAFEQTNINRYTTSYTFDNKDAKRARTIITEQPKIDAGGSGWKLVSAQKPVEETQSVYRFETEVPAGTKADLATSFELTESSTYGITNIDLPTLLTHRQNGKASDAVVNAFKEVARRQAEINDFQRTAADLVRQMDDITKEQARIRDNMNRLERTDPLYNRYVKKLTDQETLLEELRDKREKAQQKVNQLTNDLNAYIASLNVE